VTTQGRNDEAEPVAPDEGRSGGQEAITPEGIRALEAEITELETNERRRMAERIKAARELGDLKENAEYHIAKEDQAHLETKIKRLRERLASAVVVEASEDSDRFRFGGTAEVVDVEGGKTHTWTLVGATEADMASGKLSAASPVGQALRDSALGETVTVETPGGSKTFRVARIVD